MAAYTHAQISDYLRFGFWDWSMGKSDLKFASKDLTVDLSGISAEAKALARDALDTYAAATDLSFTETRGAADITFKEPAKAVAHTSLDRLVKASDGGWEIEHATVEVGARWLDLHGTSRDGYSYQTFLHEIGHALGLGHAGAYDGNATFGRDNHYANDSWQTTIMSYFTQSENTKVDASFAWAVTPQVADLIALQEMYGAGDGRGGNTTYGYNATRGLGVYDADRFDENISYTVWDAGGIDTLDYSGSATDDAIDLRAAPAGGAAVFASSVWGETGNVMIAPGVVIENAIGGAGDNVMIGNAVRNRLDGGAGNDRLNGGGDGDVLRGGAGNDWLNGGSDADALFGGSGDDVLRGSAGDDGLRGNSGADSLRGGSGDDSLIGGGGDDWLNGNGGADRVYGGSGDDGLKGSAGDDGVRGNGGADWMSGGSGEDSLTGGGGHDELLGNAGMDRLYGGNGDDKLRGGGDADLLMGNAGADRLYGGAGNDDLAGGGGDDRINGDRGSDLLSGGGGGDLFIFEEGSDRDVITDFELGSDTLRLDSDLWSGSRTAQQVIDTFAALQGSDALFDFGEGDTVALLGVGTLDLEDELLVV